MTKCGACDKSLNYYEDHQDWCVQCFKSFCSTCGPTELYPVMKCPICPKAIRHLCAKTCRFPPHTDRVSSLLALIEISDCHKIQKEDKEGGEREQEEKKASTNESEEESFHWHH